MITRAVLRICNLRHVTKRYLYNATPSTPPQAYLTPVDVKNLPPETQNEFQDVRCLTMDRRDAKNALSARMVAEMREGIAKIQASHSARLLILQTPHPGIFCAGADLRERAKMTPNQVSSFLDSLRALLAELENLAIPTIATVDGYALGGGAELALACDLRVGGDGTKIALPETKLGIIPGAGGTQRLTRVVGVCKAKELIFTGRRIDGAEAERIGLLNILAKPPETAWTATLLLARQILTSAPLALRVAKQAIVSAPDLPIEKGLDLERELYNSLLDSSDRQEGLRAFAEKRKAVFTGK